MTSGVLYRYRDRKTLMVFLYLLAFSLLISVYEFYISPAWGYTGFISQVNGTKIVISALSIIIFVVSTPKDISVRSFFLNIILCLCLLPSMTMYACADKSTYSAIVIWIALSIVYFTSAIRLKPLGIIGVNAEILMWISMFLTSFLILLFYLFGGSRYFNLELSKVYDFRHSAADLLPGFFGYISSSFSKILIPIGVCISLMYRKYYATILFILISIIQFGFTNHKSMLFTPFIVLFCYYALLNYRGFSNVIIIIIIGLALGLFSSVFVYTLDDDSFWGWYNSLFLRRSLMIPTILNYNYIDFFSENQYNYWSSSKITLGLVKSPYIVDVPQVIGDYYYNNIETSANTGFIGSGFAQAGIVGVILYSAGVGLVLAFLQAYGRRLGLPFVITVSVQSVLTMIASTDFITLFLTHGALLLFVLLSIVKPLKPSPKDIPRKTRRRGLHFIDKAT